MKENVHNELNNSYLKSFPPLKYMCIYISCKNVSQVDGIESNIYIRILYIKSNTYIRFNASGSFQKKIYISLG